jgi:hypothetical protein
MEQVVVTTSETGPDAPVSETAKAAPERIAIETEKGIQFLAPEAVDPMAARPEWLPEKFKSPAELAKAYQELERKIGKPAAPETAPESPAPKAADTPQAPDVQLGEFAKYTDEYTKTGNLSEQSYKELLDRGIPKVLVDNYIANFKSAASTQVAALEAQVVAAVGGPQEYAAMQVWASKNFSAEEITAYNRAMETNDPQMMAFAVRGLEARFKANSEPRLISAAPNSKSSGFRSHAEMTAAMRDPRYAIDPAYRADVAARIKSSNLFGVGQ